jgi:uncharacterized sporulation protein YeaH/YhbH (DUF444 family)
VPLNIENDLNRFKDIVKGRLRKDLKRYMGSGELLGKQGDKVVSIPLPNIQIPRLRYGKNEGGGVGQGEGQGQQGDGQGEAGNQAGKHVLEVDITLEELAEILGDELELPNIQPRGQKEIKTAKDKYTGIAQQGPESLRHTKRTFRQALKRQIASGTYDPGRPRIVPVKEDKRYRTWKAKTEPQSAAVIIYMMDVSGSMGKEQKEIVRLEAFWIDTWLRNQFQNVDTRFIIHDAVAREVDRDTFFRTRESGGTLISSAYNLCMKIINEEYPADEWNIYPFHFSDGDNWSASDTRACLDLVEKQMLPVVNQFSYGQVESEYGSGQFIRDLTERFDGNELVSLSRIPDREGIMNSIKDFLGKGH